MNRLITWLMRPRVRRVRRWSFLVTLPVALVVGHFYGVVHGLLVLAIRLVFGERWRCSPGGSAGSAARRCATAELDVLTVLPRLLVERLFAPQPATRMPAVDAGLLAVFDLAGLARDAAQPG